jgi:hypothetical protein
MRNSQLLPITEDTKLKGSPSGNYSLRDTGVNTNLFTSI